jgi:hypothetical protein
MTRTLNTTRLFRMAKKAAHRVPLLRAPLKAVNRVIKAGDWTFDGWNMRTWHALPWDDAHDWQAFRQAAIDGKRLVFSVKSENTLDELLWRYWNLAFAVRHAVRATGTAGGHPELVECGSADGHSAFFIAREATAVTNGPFSLHLYDAWASMRNDELLPSEARDLGTYSSLSMSRTQANLAEFADQIIYHPGHIPASLDGPPSAPAHVVFLHIDLNSAMPTQAALDRFGPRMPPGAVVVFDDYGWRGYPETKEVVDAWAAERPGTLLKSPTGQALFFQL